MITRNALGFPYRRACCAPADHPHHIIHRGNGGSDDLSNLQSLCFEHHLIAHKDRNPRWSKREAFA
jgi:hypothetical protein